MRWRIALYVSLAVAAISFAFGVRDVARAHLRAADVLRRFASRDASGFASPEVEERLESIEPLETGEPRVRSRVYRPRGKLDVPGLVLVHGIHQLGIDEPRLVRFARALAASGIAVCTPEIRELADYRVDKRSIASIGASAHALALEVSGPVGVMGMSFAGGLSLLAARDRRFASDIALVVAVGAHDDAARVAQFFATSRIARADGTTAWMRVHPYGALVFVYAHARGFFDPSDEVSARQALLRWLGEDRDAARAIAARVSPAAHLLLTQLFDGDLADIAPRIAGAARDDAQALASVSPRGHIADLRVPVYLLHGAGDTVIPPTEATWLAADVPRRLLRAVLISRALVHVEPGGQATSYEQWELLHFIAQVLSALDHTRH